MSTGFCTEASAGSARVNARRVAGVSCASDSPRPMQASVQRIPGPPALVTMAIRSPAGSGCWASAAAWTNISSSERARSTPHCSSSDSVAMSRPTIEPVCDDAARAPAAVRPALTVMIGFLRVTRRASWVKFRGLPNDSRYIRTTWTSSLSSQYSSRSLPETSVLLPIETNMETPRPQPAASARIASPSAPDWEISPTLPRAGTAAAKVALSRTSGSVLITPMQLGPTMRMP